MSTNQTSFLQSNQNEVLQSGKVMLSLQHMTPLNIKSQAQSPSSQEGSFHQSMLQVIARKLFIFEMPSLK